MDNETIIEISPFDTKEIVNSEGEIEIVSILIPQCCREGWDSCTHVAKKHSKLKTNVGL